MASNPANGNFHANTKHNKHVIITSKRVYYVVCWLGYSTVITQHRQIKGKNLEYTVKSLI